jgi:hypothetical protein
VFQRGESYTVVLGRHRLTFWADVDNNMHGEFWFMRTPEAPIVEKFLLKLPDCPLNGHERHEADAVEITIDGLRYLAWQEDKEDR